MTISVFPKEPISQNAQRCPIALALLARGIRAAVCFTRVDVYHFGMVEKISLPKPARDFVQELDFYVYSGGPLPKPFVLHLPVQ